MKKNNNNNNVIKYIVAVALLTSALDKPVLASSRQPNDKQMQDAFFETVHKGYLKKKAASIIASQLDINTYPTDPDWTYFPTLTETELDEIDRKDAVRIQGFKELEKFSPEEIEETLKEAESNSKKPQLQYEHVPQHMATVAAVESKEATTEPRTHKPNATQSRITCPGCYNNYARIQGLKTHILRKHCTANRATADDEYSPTTGHQEDKEFLCNYCNAPVTLPTCICHIARTCPVLHKQKREENHEKKQ